VHRTVAALLCGAVLLATSALAGQTVLPYPPASRGDVTDTYFGTKVADPYRWLEDLDAPSTVAWVRAENSLTRNYLDAIPQRAAIATAYRTLYNYPKVGTPFRYGSHWFIWRNSGLQTEGVLYIRDSEFGPERIFFDPNTLSKDGSVQLADSAFSRDGTLLAYSTSSGGADWETWHVKSVPSGRDLPDRLEWSKYAWATWLGNRGFYYSGYDKPRTPNATAARLGAHKIWFHRLGSPQKNDRLVYASTRHPNEFVGVSALEDQSYYFLTRAKGHGNSLAWKRRDEPDSAFREILPLDPNVFYTPIGHDGSRVYLETNLSAPNLRVVVLDLRDPKHAFHDVVPNGPDKLEGVSLIGDRFYLGYLHDAHSALSIVDVHGRAVGTIALPGVGTAWPPSATRRRDRIAYYTYMSYAYPSVTFRYDTATGASTIYHRSEIAFDGSPYVTEQRFATSKDGTRIPVFITHRIDIPLDGSTPTILYGYGGFGISWTPSFSVTTALWLKMGGAYAVATLRGGGEYGEAWHDAGRLANKQHVFDDFIAAAELLVRDRITSPAKLALNGGSNGGLLVGAVVTERPDLCAAAVTEQGLYDMLRYQTFTVGKAWIPEFGSAEQSASEFATLAAYSPLQNVKEGTSYPAMLIETADHDDRVYPGHSFKFAAALQHAQAGGAPILLRVETNEGHFAGLTTDKQIAQVADFYAFLVKNLDFTPSL
jgi:prolyl oligopeptidase